MARKHAGKHSRSKSSATSSGVKNNNGDGSSPGSTAASNVTGPSSSSSSPNTLALPSTTPSPTPSSLSTAPAPAATPAGGLPFLYRFLLLLYPIVQMLLSVEAPLRPFSALRHPSTGELQAGGEELIEPRILVVAPHVRDLGFFAPTVGVLLGTERKGRCWVGVLGVSSASASAKGGKDGKEREREWKDALETFGTGLDVGLLDVPELQDNPEIEWDPDVVADNVLPYVLEYNIDTILTFDEGGITGNPHHAAVSKGITSLVRSQKLKDALTSSSKSSSKKGNKKEKDPEKSKSIIHPRAYLLHTPTSPLLNPGLGPLSSVAQHFVLVYRAFRNRSTSSGSSSETGKPVVTIPPTTTFISSIWIYGRSWKALLKISEEMYLGNILGWMVSRSLWVNEWVQVV